MISAMEMLQCPPSFTDLVSDLSSKMGSPIPVGLAGGFSKQEEPFLEVF